MDDLISRKSLLRNILGRLGIVSEEYFTPQEYVVVDCIYKEPSAHPKTGKWIEYEKCIKITSYKCSECGRIVRDDTGYDVSEDYPFCHCGCDMRGKQE